MGFEHERIHLETSSVLMSELPIEYVKFPQGFPSYHPSTQDTSEIVRDPVAGVHYPAPEMVPVQAQAITLGKPADAPSFGWDNEYGRRTFDVPAFAASKYKTTNGEYLEFVREGGYARKELWTEAGWKWRAFRNAKWPFFWVREGPQGLNHFRLRLIFDEVPMQWDWPVSVNQHEASAFAKWKSLTTGRNMRVSTELEHNAMRNPSQQSGSGEEVDHVVAVKGNMMVEMGVNTNLSCASMSPVVSLLHL
jgi:formylglycine-generating enzyme required for sulfatase activity